MIWRALRNEIQLPKPKDEQMLITLHITLFLFKFLSLFHFSPQYQFLAFFLTALIFWFFFIKEKEQQNVGNGAIESLRIKSDLLNFISIAQAAGLRNCNGAVIGLFSKPLRMFWNCFASLATQPNKGAFCNYWWKVRVFGEEMKIIKMCTHGSTCTFGPSLTGGNTM